MPCRKTESPQSAVCSATISSDPGISGARGTKAPCFLASFSIAVSINDVFNNVLRLQCCPLVHRICFARWVRSPPQVCAGHKAWKSLSIAKARRASGCRLHAGGLEGFAEVASNSKLHRRRSISQLSVRFLMFFDLANFARQLLRFHASSSLWKALDTGPPGRGRRAIDTLPNMQHELIPSGFSALFAVGSVGP